jgi:alkane 1-monooxygenase
MNLSWWNHKKLGYLLFLLPPLLLPAMYGIGKFTGYWNIATLLVPFVLFFAVPAVDLLIGRDERNASGEAEAAVRADRQYTWLLVACFPVQLAALGFGAWVVRDAPLSLFGRVMWIVSQGLVSGIIAINTGHELIHRTRRSLRLTGGALLATVGYATFMVEHTLGHHVQVATEEDPSSAKRGDNVYRFMAFAIAHNIQRGFGLERAKLNRASAGKQAGGKPSDQAGQARERAGVFGGSELWPLYGFTVMLCVACALFAGVLGVAFMLGQSLIAIALLEVINFVEHYGLSRDRLPSGRGYVTTTPMHSWNSNFLFTNLLLFQLQRHSDHHANAARPYQVLRHMPDSPQLPFGYATMVVIALMPPLFRAVVHPLLDARDLAKCTEALADATRPSWVPAGWVPQRAYSFVTDQVSAVQVRMSAVSTRVSAVTERVTDYVKFLQ